MADHVLGAGHPGLLALGFPALCVGESPGHPVQSRVALLCHRAPCLALLSLSTDASGTP